MATARRKAAARKNIRKTQRARRTKSARARAAARTTTKARRKAAARSKSATRSRTTRRAQPKARRRAGSGRGKFFHIELRPKSDFTEFRTHDVGRKGGIERVAGRRAGGSWSTQKWLIAKNQAHIEGDSLVGDTADARQVLSLLGSHPKRIRADRFGVEGGAQERASARPSQAPRRAGLPNIHAPQKGRKWA
jgi:hypothetical protein